MNHLKSSLLVAALAMVTLTSANAQTLIATAEQNLLPL